MDLDAKSERFVPIARCPACGTPVDSPSCPACGIWLAGDHASELRLIDSELRRIDEARTWLYNRRTVLLADLVHGTADRASGSPSHAPGRAGPAQRTLPPPKPPRNAATGSEPAEPEMSRRTAGRLLLAAGATLVVIATTAFTVANWSSVRPAGRCAILLALTAVVLVMPLWLRRRHLSATAEAVAAVGLALTLADVYLLERLFPVRGLVALAATLAALAALWAAYGLATRLRIPRLAAIVAGQLPCAIAAMAMARAVGGTPIAGPTALALVLTSAADLGISRWTKRDAHSDVAVTSSIAATVTWVAAIALGATTSLAVQPSLPARFWTSAVLVTAGVVGVGLLARSAVPWVPARAIAVASGGLLAIGLALPEAADLHSRWHVVPVTLAGAVVAVGARLLARVGSSRESAAERAGSLGPAAILWLAAAGSAAIAGATGLIELPAALSGMFPLHTLADPWSGPTFPPPLTATSHLAGTLAPAIVLGVVSLACWVLPRPGQPWLRPAAVAIAALAAGSIPAAGFAGWAGLAVLTAAGATMLGASGLIRSPREGAVAMAASCSGMGLALSAILWSLTWPAATIVEFAALTVICSLVAASAAVAGRIAAGCAVATATGLACAVPLATGSPVEDTAFAVLGVAVAAVGIATLLRRARPSHAIVLDVAAGLVALLAAVLTAQHAVAFAVLAAVAALAASSAAWLRTGRQRVAISCGALLAACAAITADGRPLALALFRPYAQLGRPWHGLTEAPIPGLALAVIVALGCAVAVATAAGAWRGGQTSLNTVAVALPIVVAPTGLASSLRFGLMVGLLLVLAVALTAWTAVSRSLAPAGAALAAAVLALAWALAAPAPTLIVLGCLAVAYVLCGWLARRPEVRAVSACLGVLSAAALAEAAAFAAGGAAWQAGLAVLGVAAIAHIAAGYLSSVRRQGEKLEGSAVLGRAKQMPRASTAIEVGAWLAVIAGTAQCLSRPGPASAALAAAGLICAGVAVRADRRGACWIGVALCEAAWCVRLRAAGVGTPEAYTVPAAAAGIAYGWQLARRRRRLSSWLTYGPGLALLLLPSLIALWQDHGWVRPLSLGLGAAAITLTGARLRLQAPLLIGAVVAALDAGHELAPPIRRLAETVPTWLPIAITGTILLWAGATYEARLRNLSTLRKTVGAMR
ncbi:MAG TPA: zinc ribbon domain-containing protein [Streptosporangiaceae bacterium]|nr:zinc ribbon domain-containing protein [Streptosporangiaceae bacterium]